MTLINSNRDVRPLFNQPFDRVKGLADASRQLDARYAALRAKVDSLLKDSEEALEAATRFRNEADELTNQDEEAALDAAGSMLEIGKELRGRTQRYVAEMKDIEALQSRTS